MSHAFKTTVLELPQNFPRNSLTGLPAGNHSDYALMRTWFGSLEEQMVVDRKSRLRARIPIHFATI